MPRLDEVLAFSPGVFTSRSSELLACSKTLVGVELELERLNRISVVYNVVRPKAFWSTVDEPSIRDGGELVLSQPLNGLDLLNALDEYTNFLHRFEKYFKSLPVISNRCSLHVHIDARDLQLSEINSFSILYTLMEKVIFEFLDPNRLSNNYCIPLSFTDFDNILNNMPDLECTGSNYISYIDSYCDKYGSLNHKSLLKYGSLEFRCHPGTFDSREILLWINILLSMKNYSKNVDLRELILGDKCAEEIVSEIFGRFSAPLISTDNFNSNFNFGKAWAIELLCKDSLSTDTLGWLNSSNKSDEILIDKFMEVNKCAVM